MEAQEQKNKTNARSQKSKLESSLKVADFDLSGQTSASVQYNENATKNRGESMPFEIKPRKSEIIIFPDPNYEDASEINRKRRNPNAKTRPKIGE